MRVKSVVLAAVGTLGCVASLLLASGIESTGNFAQMCGWALASFCTFGLSMVLIGIASVYADAADERDRRRKAHNYRPKHTVKASKKKVG